MKSLILAIIGGVVGGLAGSWAGVNGKSFWFVLMLMSIYIFVAAFLAVILIVYC